MSYLFMTIVFKQNKEDTSYFKLHDALPETNETKPTTRTNLACLTSTHWELNQQPSYSLTGDLLTAPLRTSGFSPHLSTTSINEMCSACLSVYTLNADTVKMLLRFLNVFELVLWFRFGSNTLFWVVALSSVSHTPQVCQPLSRFTLQWKSSLLFSDLIAPI